MNFPFLRNVAHKTLKHLSHGFKTPKKTKKSANRPSPTQTHTHTHTLSLSLSLSLPLSLQVFPMEEDVDPTVGCATKKPRRDADLQTETALFQTVLCAMPWQYKRKEVTTRW
jgi:hypothetical protein